MLENRHRRGFGSRIAAQRKAGLPREAGFSLVELLVTVIILAEVLVGLLIVFDSSSRLARAQTHVAELQQSLRVGQSELTRFARMAGLGGLPIMPLNEHARDNLGSFPEAGPAVSVFNDVAEQTIVQLLDSGADSDDDDVLLPGSDVLILRGVFSTPMFYLDPPAAIGTADDDGTACNEDGLFVDTRAAPNGNRLYGKVTLPARARIAGRSYWDYPQEIDDLAQRLINAKADQEALALMLRDTLNPNAYVIVAFDHENTLAGDLVPDDTKCNIDRHINLPAEHRPQCISFCVELKPGQAAADGPGDAYSRLSAGTSLDPDSISADTNPRKLVVDASADPDFEILLPTEIGSVGLVEEYRFYARAEWEVPGKTDTRLTPVLARAEFLPGTNSQIDRIDIADNVLDLQIAVGADADEVDEDGYGEITDNGDGADEVLFNSADDEDSTTGDLEDAQGATSSEPWSGTDIEFHFLRLNTLVQARLPDRSQRAPAINPIEDHDRGEQFSVEGVSYTFKDDQRYQRRWLRTMIELRNLQ